MQKTVLAILIAAAGGAAAAQQPPDPDKVEVKATKVAGSVWVITGAGGNIGVSVGADGIVLVDDQFAPLAPKIEAALKGIADKPLRFVVNTHWHGDHTGGNLHFGARAPVLAHDNVRKRLAAGATRRFMGREMKIEPAPAGALPIVTFGRRVSLHLNGEGIRAVDRKSTRLNSSHEWISYAVFCLKKKKKKKNKIKEKKNKREEHT